MSRAGLVVFDTHPIQYHAPVYRELQRNFGIQTTVIYGSDFSLAGGRDPEFWVPVTWDVDLTSGYESIFLSRVAKGGARTHKEVSGRGLRPVLRRLNPRAVLVVGYAEPFHQAALWHAWRARVPILFRAETADGPNRGWLKEFFRDHALKQLYSRCARLLYIGRHSQEHYKRLGCPDRKMVFSPYCVETSPFKCSEEDRTRLRGPARAELGIGDQEIVLLFSGKLIPRKRPQALLQAVQRLDPEIRRRVRVMFMGEGEERKALSAQAAAAGIPAHFLGFKNQTQLSRYYHVSDLLVFPSSWEPWGLVVNEALHHGVACVVTDAVQSQPDLIQPGQTGEVCPAESAEKLAVEIERALSWGGSAGVREACRRKVADYSVEKAAEGIALAYRAVADG